MRSLEGDIVVVVVVVVVVSVGMENSTVELKCLCGERRLERIPAMRLSRAIDSASAAPRPRRRPRWRPALAGTRVASASFGPALQSRLTPREA